MEKSFLIVKICVNCKDDRLGHFHNLHLLRLYWWFNGNENMTASHCGYSCFYVTPLIWI